MTARWRSVLAVVVGLLTVAVLSLGTDQAFHSLGVYPPWGEPMHDAALNVLALAYRCGYGVLGGYIAARLDPARGLHRAVVVGSIGTALSAAGAAAAVPLNLSPSWLHVALVITALPTAWAGGRVAIGQRRPVNP